MDIDLEVKLSGKKIKVRALKAGLLDRIRGLMFRLHSKNILFEFRRDVDYSLHSIFVFLPFLVLWLDEKNNVIDFTVVKNMRFNISTKNKYRKILEIPLSTENQHFLSFFRRRKGLNI